MQQLTAFIFLWITTAGVYAQEGFYTGFDLVAGNDRVTLEWTITAGNTCNGTYLERSTDGHTFDTVNIITGICGDPFQSVYYSYVDTTPVLNAVNYYRLRFGNIATSHILTATVVDFRSMQHQWIIAPTSGTVQLHFDNPAREEVRIALYTLQGQLWRQFTTSASYVAMETPRMAPLFFRIYKNNTFLSAGKVPFIRP